MSSHSDLLGRIRCSGVFGQPRREAGSGLGTEAVSRTAIGADLFCRSVAKPSVEPRVKECGATDAC
jgi:hypothetical protein